MIILNTFEIIGTIAFAISGALVGIRKQLDIFGIIFLALTTAVGGGIFRDIFLGNTPPVAFIKPIFAIISILSAIFTLFFYKKVYKFQNIVLISDAIGLGAFTVIGANTALAHNMNEPFIVISMGLLTGVGGGILRDVFAKEIPFVFQKEIYATASILGGLIFFYTYNMFQHILAMYVCFLVTFSIRIIALKYDLNLPVLKNKSNLAE